MRFQNCISIPELKALLPQNPFIIDIRDPLEFAKFHIPIAKNVPYQQLVMYPEQFLTKTHVYYIICSNGSKSMRAAHMLNSMGYKTISVYGGYPL